MADEDKYLSVTDLNYYINQKFKNDPYLHKVFLKGELSNFRFRMNSHQYFSLKDEKSKINIVMFRSFFEKLKFKPKEGMKVYISGYVGVYEPQGSYQFYAQTMEPAGLGELYECLRQLQEKLTKEGLFDQEHKRPLPHFPNKIAVVTSASGAVIHDIMVTANRRYPLAEIDLYPAKVQGDTAADSLVRAMRQINDHSDEYDEMIIGRGGGSLEDLWPFNEEVVVRQIYNMKMPVISSVGHETDVTLSDLVADARAATPTAAAEYATPNLVDEIANIHQLQSRMYASIQTTIKQRKQALDRVNSSIIMREPMRLYDQQVQRVDDANRRLVQAAQNIFNEKSQKYLFIKQKLNTSNLKSNIQHDLQQVLFIKQKLNHAMQNVLKDKQNKLATDAQHLNDISPLQTLARGFVYTSDNEGKTITSVKQLNKGDNLILHFKDGKAETKVISTQGEKNGY